MIERGLLRPFGFGLAGLAVFGMVLAAVSYRTGRLGMNMVAHATFNFVAIVAIASNGNALIH